MKTCSMIVFSTSCLIWSIDCKSKLFEMLIATDCGGLERQTKLISFPEGSWFEEELFWKQLLKFVCGSNIFTLWISYDFFFFSKRVFCCRNIFQFVRESFWSINRSEKNPQFQWLAKLCFLRSECSLICFRPACSWKCKEDDLWKT